MHERLKKYIEETGMKFGNELSNRNIFEALLHTSLEDGGRYEHVYQTLMNFIEFDMRVKMSSKAGACREHPAFWALVGLKEVKPNGKMRLTMHLLNDLAYKDGSWTQLDMLYVLHDKDNRPKVPEEHRGKFRKLVEDWLEWGEENGYFIPDI